MLSVYSRSGTRICGIPPEPRSRVRARPRGFKAGRLAAPALRGRLDGHGSRRARIGVELAGCFSWSTNISMWYICTMTAKVLKEALQRVESWPVEAQEELAEIAFEIDAGLNGGAYHATPQELEGIDRGLKASREGRFATTADVEAVLAKHRRA